jgi:hypothetical protein
MQAGRPPVTFWRSFKEKQLASSREGVLETVPATEGVPPGEPCRGTEVAANELITGAIDVIKS